MKKEFKIRRFISLLLLFGGIFAVSGAFSTAHAQRDPFQKPVVRTTTSKNPNPTTTNKPVINVVKKPEKKLPPPVVPVPAPKIEERIMAYRAQLAFCKERGLPCPKPTMVMTLEEMEVRGIFRSPRGFSAMVELTPIKMSYVIYPGERFYNGVLVGIEEKQLVFRRDVRMSNGKTIVVAESKPLMQQSPVDEFAKATSTETAENKTTTETKTTTEPKTSSTNTVSPQPNPTTTVEDEKTTTVEVPKVNPNEVVTKDSVLTVTETPTEDTAKKTVETKEAKNKDKKPSKKTVSKNSGKTVARKKS